MALHLSRPAESVAATLQTVYAPEISHSDGELSLQTSSNNITKLSDIFAAIAESVPSAKEIIFGSDAGKVQSWLERVGGGVAKEDLTVCSSYPFYAIANDPQDVLEALDAELKGSTFLVGTTQTAADTALCAAVYPHVKAASHDERLQWPSVARHFDLIQHSPLLSKAIPDKVSIDLDNVPLVARKAEAKPKKEKAAKAQEGGAAAAAAAGGGGEAKEPKQKQPKGEGEQQPKKEKKQKNAAPQPQPADNTPAPHMVDLRVGKIVKVERHPDADSLYVEQIDLGEPTGPRTVVSGLVKYVPIEQMQDRYLVAVCNLKPASMRGVKSFAMVLCASSKEGKDAGVEIVEVPEGSQPGDRVYFEGMQEHQPLEVLNPKKKIFETIQPGFTTLDNREAAWIDPKDQKSYRIMTDRGTCKAPSFVGASLS